MMAAASFSARQLSREEAGRHIPRHRHFAPYAAIILRGGYVEAGDCGRFRAVAGDVLLHDRFEAHQDHIDSGGADILNLALPERPTLAFGRTADPEALRRLADRDPAAAATQLIAELDDAAGMLADWPDLLAADLRAGRVGDLRDWADAHGLWPSSVSRGFRLCYGVSPQCYRLEQRAAKAARAARQRRDALAQIAAEFGFADQSHLCRVTTRLYGLSPAALRAADNCVQDRPFQVR
jgi:AraC-like DNA-binding protein